MEGSMLDALDRQIIHILAIEPRASFRTIADVTGISDQTAARRYRRLCEDAGLRVLAVPDGSRLGWTDWFIRLQTTPGGADSIAEALARRPDTRWVHLASGGTEIICTLQARTEEQRDALFLHGLPGSRRVVQISAHSILHNFNPGPWREATRALSPSQLDRLAVLAGGNDPPQTPPAHGGAARPSIPPGARAEDEPLLAELARDGRASNAAIAAAIHWHESSVRRRIDELRRSGLVYFEVDVDNRVQGLNAHAVLWLSVEPARLEEAGRALATHPEIPFVAATTGPANLVASAVFRDLRHLYEYLTGELAGLSGVTSVETAPIIRTLKRTGSVH
ncbi:MAG TPA: Lrp/AsnC family transcriptional regulator [Streptosporangiaceae bacterium]|nr:Lrp/AsnC family transcriptional regulator [Streptosporangiaceae bacterium]